MPIQTIYSNNTAPLIEQQTVTQNVLFQLQKASKTIASLFQSALALLLGSLPFIGANIGKLVIKASAYAADFQEAILFKLGIVGAIISIAVRALIGIGAFFGGILAFGGASLFSKSQALIWGQDWIEHTTGKEIYTPIARYGASDQPLHDFKNLLAVFFHPLGNLSPIEVIEGTDSDGEIAHVLHVEDSPLTRWQNFEMK